MTISTSSLVWFHRSFGLLSPPGGGGPPRPPAAGPAPFPRPPAAALAAAAALIAAAPVGPAPRPAPPGGMPLGTPRPEMGIEPGGGACPGARRTMLLSSRSIS